MIKNIGLPEEVEKLIDEQSGIGAGMAVGKNVASSMNESLSKEPSAKKQGTRKTTSAKVPKEEESVADKLAKYKDLLDRVILTQEEYDEVKAMLMKEI